MDQKGRPGKSDDPDISLVVAQSPRYFVAEAWLTRPLWEALMLRHSRHWRLERKQLEDERVKGTAKTLVAIVFALGVFSILAIYFAFQ